MILYHASHGVKAVMDSVSSNIASIDVASMEIRQRKRLKNPLMVRLSFRRSSEFLYAAEVGAGALESSGDCPCG